MARERIGHRAVGVFGLLLVCSCAAPAVRLDPVADPVPAPEVLERVQNDLDDAQEQFGGPAWRHIEWKARAEGAQLLSLASRMTNVRIGLDVMSTMVLSVDVRPEAPETPGRVLTVHDSGRPLAVRGSFRVMLKEGDPDYPDAENTPWEAMPLGSAAGGLSLSLAVEGGSVLAWKVRNGGVRAVRWMRDPDPQAALDHGLFSLHVAGPHGHLLAPRPAEGALPIPLVDTLPPGGEVGGWIDLAAARDLVPGTVCRVALVYASYASPDRLAAYAARNAWPDAWVGALASNELVVRVTAE